MADPSYALVAPAAEMETHEALVAEASRRYFSMRRTLATVVAGSLLAAVGAVAFLTYGRSESPLSSNLRKTVEEREEAHHGHDCTVVEQHVDYVTMVQLATLRDVPSAEECRRECEDSRGCGAWTWGFEVGMPQVTHVCTMKQMDSGMTPMRVAKYGVLSGYPCTSAEARAVPMVISTSASPTRTTTTGTWFWTPMAYDTPSDAPSTTSPDFNQYVSGDRFRPLGFDMPSTTARTWTQWSTVVYTSATSTSTQRPRSTATTAPGTTREATVTREATASTSTEVTTGTPTRTATGTATTKIAWAAKGKGELFCWALMLPSGYEPGLLAMQYKKGVSLFACDEHAVYSNKSLSIAPGLTTHVVPIDLHCDFGGEFHTALNMHIFRHIWEAVVGEGRFALYDWTVKVDPDCVFMPDRLRHVVKDHSEGERGTYLNNCQFGLHGPIEVFSRKATKELGTGWGKCEDHFTKLCSGDCWWGEDLFIDQCLHRVLRVQRDNVSGLLTEDHCQPPPGWKDCTDKSAVAFHPFKDSFDYQNCADNAAGRSVDVMRFK